MYEVLNLIRTLHSADSRVLIGFCAFSTQRASRAHVFKYLKLGKAGPIWTKFLMNVMPLETTRNS